jgi:hypothetical protein
MEAFLVSTGIVALAEMGDKTQLLSLVLAARFRKPWPIVAGIFVATSSTTPWPARSALGHHWLGPDVLRWVLGGSFIAMAIWMLIPDKLDDDVANEIALRRLRRHGHRLLPGRDGRQDAGRHGDAGRALRQLGAGGGGHHAGHDAGERAGGLVRRPHRAQGADPGSCTRWGRWCSWCWGCWCSCAEAGVAARPTRGHPGLYCPSADLLRLRALNKCR